MRLPQPAGRLVPRDVGFAEDLAHADAVVQGLLGGPLKSSHTCTRTRSHTYERTFTCTCVRMYLRTYVRAYRTYVQTYVRTYVSVCEVDQDPHERMSDFVACDGPWRVPRLVVHRTSLTCACTYVRTYIQYCSPNLDISKSV